MPRNVLLISADQWRGDCLSMLGHPVVQTPNLDAFAQEAMTFTRHFSNTAPCGPARTTMLTGLYPFNHRSVRNGTPLDSRHSNVALEARKAGYDPVLFGYTDTSPDPRLYAAGDPILKTYEGVMPGFRLEATLLDISADSWFADLARKGYALPDPADAIYRRGEGREVLPFTTAPARYHADDSDSAYITDRVIDYLGRHAQENWFVHAVYMRPHPPLVAPAPYNDMFRPADMALPQRREDAAAEAAQHPFLAYWLQAIDNPDYLQSQINCRNASDDDVRAMRAVYYGLISEVDHQVGRLLTYLREAGLMDDTLILFTADHGEQLGEHWLWGKGGYFDASYHVPMMVRVPEAVAEGHGGKTCDAFSEAVDVMPTILDWLGLDIPAVVDGASLCPIASATTPENWRDSVYIEFDFRDPVGLAPETRLGLKPDQCTLCLVRDRFHKYVHFSALPPLLFDLQADPHEFNNLAQQSSAPASCVAYAGKLLSHRLIHADRTFANHMITAEGVKEYRGPRR